MVLLMLKVFQVAVAKLTPTKSIKQLATARDAETVGVGWSLRRECALISLRKKDHAHNHRKT